MCGIAGLFLKSPSLEPDLGRLMSGMLAVLTERGPDSAGFAIYGHGVPGQRKFTLRTMGTFGDLTLPAGLDLACVEHDDHAVISFPAAREAELRAALARHPEITIAATGERMELFKGVGLPGEVSKRFGLAAMSGSHAIGHTRMATESAVTTAGAHPFSTGPGPVPGA